jgi:hypothetical protein
MLLSNTFGSLGTFSLDGESPSPFKVPNTSSSLPIYNFELLTAVLASDGSHTLEITAGAAGSFYLDYILLETGSAFVTDLVSSSGSGSESGSGNGSGEGFNGGNGGGTAGGGSGSGGDSDSSGGGGSGNSVGSGNRKIGSANVGAITGGVVGGVVALATIGLVIFFWSRRRQRRQMYEVKDTFTIGLAAEARHHSAEAYSDARRQKRGQGQGGSTPMYQQQRTETGMCLFVLHFTSVNVASHVMITFKRTRPPQYCF